MLKITYRQENLKVTNLWFPQHYLLKKIVKVDFSLFWNFEQRLERPNHISLCIQAFFWLTVGIIMLFYILQY